MKININAIGKIKDPAIQSIINEYIKRLKWRIMIHDFPPAKDNDIGVIKRKEGALLMPMRKADVFTIAMDEAGDHLSSKEFAAKISDVQLSGCSEIFFLIGGAHGHTDATLKDSNMALSLSKMTFPHQLARLLLVEQIYRAYTILLSHPYHKI